MNNAMRGIDFTVTGVVRTDKIAYIILVDESASLYFPIQCAEAQAVLIESILSDNFDFDVKNYGLYFSFLSMFKAHDMFPTQVSFTIGKNGGVTSLMDVTEENELGFKVSRVPLLLVDAVVLCSIGRMPIVIYGAVGTEFAFKINKDIPKQNVFSFICDEIIKSERLSAIHSEED